MAWALALVVVIGVGLPVAAWLITRRLPPPRAMSGLGAGYDAIDKWLLDQYQLAPPERWRVRKAVFRGDHVRDAMLTPAAHGLAIRVLGGGFRILRLSQLLGWVDVAMATGVAGAGIAMLVTNQHAEGFLMAVLGLIGGGLLMFAGVMRALWFPKQIRRNAAKALHLNQHST